MMAHSLSSCRETFQKSINMLIQVRNIKMFKWVHNIMLFFRGNGEDGIYAV